MYICLDCGHVFEEPNEPRGVIPSGRNNPDWYSQCTNPACRSENYVQAKYCTSCGEWRATTVDGDCTACEVDLDE